MDLTKIGAVAASQDSTAPVFGRVLQADADFFCYECAFIDEPFAVNFKNLLQRVEMKRKAARAERVNVFVTLGLKGGRHEMATVKPYQDKRGSTRDPAVSQRVLELRTALGNHRSATITPMVCMFQEADDAICQEQERMIEKFGYQSTVVMSSDKDLWMVRGLHCDSDTGEFTHAQGYGATRYKDVGNKEPKLVGLGTSWFWHQMVMGDAADTIPGLPMLAGVLANRYLPLKTHNPNRGAVKCGEAKAVAMLKDVNSDQEAFNRVFEAYVHHYGNDAKEMFFEQAFLLWMRRKNHVLDALDFLRPLGFDYKLTKNQRDALETFREACFKLKRMSQCAS